jgi:fumarate reductase subunit D
MFLNINGFSPIHRTHHYFKNQYIDTSSSMFKQFCLSLIGTVNYTNTGFRIFWCYIFSTAITNHRVFFAGRRRWTSSVSRRWIFRIGWIGVVGLWMRQNRRARCVREGVLVHRLDQSNHQRKQFVILDCRTLKGRKNENYRNSSGFRSHIHRLFIYLFIIYFILCFCRFNKNDEHNMFLFRFKM